jgi:formyltetrahydrofolate-dependent phosphoribosylglycinamide formyltransferase
MLNIAAFGSGRGSNLEAILTAIQQRAIRGARICLVVSNNSNAGILEIAQANALPTAHLSQKEFANETQFVDRLIDTLKIHGTDFIVLAGYMKQLHPRVIQTYRNRIINIHPALLPKYGGKGMYGASVHEAVIAAREKFSGATVHIVDEEYDRGPIVLQKKVAVAPDDTPETLAAKVLAVEHEIYPAAVRLFAEGKIVVKDDKIAVYHS